MTKVKSKANIVAIVTATVLIVYAILMFIPIFWTLMTTFKQPNEYTFYENVLGFPKQGFTLSNYITAYRNFFVQVQLFDSRGVPYFAEFYILDQFGNSLLYSVGCGITATLTALVMGYAVARFNYKFSKIIYTFVLVTIALPIVGSLPSEIAVSNGLGLFDTFPGIWIMRASFLNTYFLIFYAQFKSIPFDYTEAAKIDGASPFTVMVKIIVPLAMNTAMAIFVLNFIAFWNDYQIPMVYLPSHPVAAYGMYKFEYDPVEATDNIPTTLAGIFLMAMPIIVFYAVFNSKLNVNMSVGGIKG